MKLHRGDKLKITGHKGVKHMDKIKVVSTTDREENAKAIRERWPFPEKPLNNQEYHEG